MRTGGVVSVVLVLAISTLIAPLATAGFYVSGAAVGDWGASDAALGFPGATVESFEDATLATGLTVEWFSTAGNTGPTGTLPALFDPAADPNGNAFVGGTWDGTHGLVTGLDNQSHPYLQAQFWGDLELFFDPAVAAVGFSVQQMDADATLSVNGQVLGGLASLASLVVNGTRLGYVRIVATGGSTISSVLLDNGGGDGFVLDRLLMVPPSAMPAVNVTGFPPAQWGAPDCALGLPGNRWIEDFEDAALVPGVEVGWVAPAGSTASSGTLPHTFDPTTDAFGNAFLPSIWDGTLGMINTPDNQSHDYAATGQWGDVELDFDPAVTTVGFSAEDMDREADLRVNGMLVGGLAGLSGLSPGSQRLGYVRLDATGGDTIDSIYVDNEGFTAGVTAGDGIAFDHLVFSGGLLVDGFECGNTDAWSDTVP